MALYKCVYYYYIIIIIIAIRNRNHHTATGNHMPQCYVPATRQR